MNGKNFFGGSNENQAVNSQSGSQFSKKSGNEAGNFNEKRQKFMENIRRTAREQITKQRRLQPTIFNPQNKESNQSYTSINYQHLDGVPNKEELIAKLEEFNQINVDGFEDKEINEIASALKTGQL